LKTLHRFDNKNIYTILCALFAIYILIHTTAYQFCKHIHFIEHNRHSTKIYTTSKVKSDNTLLFRFWSTSNAHYFACIVFCLDFDPRPPPIIHQGPQNQTLPINSVAMLQCSASGDPLPVIRWYRNGRVLPLRDPRFTLLDSGTLQISGLFHNNFWEFHRGITSQVVMYYLVQSRWNIKKRWKNVCPKFSILRKGCLTLYFKQSHNIHLRSFHHVVQSKAGLRFGSNILKPGNLLDHLAKRGF